MQHYTEDMIRQALDGTFTRLDAVTGLPRKGTVPLDYIPSHSPMSTAATGASCAGVKKASYSHFSVEEDELIVGMKAEGKSSRMIGRELGRSDTSVSDRYQRLVRQGRCQVVIA